MHRVLYTLLITLLLPIAWLRLQWRARKEPGYGKHIGERFGLYDITPSRPLIWLHAVSVGETRAAVPLIHAIKERYPNHQLLITHMTPTGRATSEALFGDTVLRCYLPYDSPFAVRRFLSHFRPTLGLLMETELWPNLIDACHTTHIPMWLINARLSQRSASRYARLKTLVADCLNKLTGICAQTSADAERLKQLGAHTIAICGNIKFDVKPPEAMRQLGHALRVRFGESRPIFLAASTREGEEALILDAIEKMRVPHMLAVIVPRHPQRFDEVAELIQKRGFNLQRRSDDKPVSATTQVVLGDSMGEMFAYYTACDVAFIGGSLLPLGGQNLIEACAVGKPVLVGPHTFNFTEATEQAIAYGAAYRVEDSQQLAETTMKLLNDSTAQKEMGQKGLLFTQSHQGAVERILTRISDSL